MKRFIPNFAKYLLHANTVYANVKHILLEYDYTDTFWPVSTSNAVFVRRPRALKVENLSKLGNSILCILVSLPFISLL